MKKSIYRIIIIAAICAFAAVAIVTGADILKSRQLLMEQAEESLGYMSENCADEFRAIFDNAELLLNDCAAVIEESVVVDETSPEIADMSELKPVIYRITDNSKYPVSIYTIFNPEYFKEDIWYVKGLDGAVDDLSGTGDEIEEWLKEWKKENSDLVKFFNEAVEAEEMWYESTYDPDIRWEVVSKTKAVYDVEGKLIGVIGIDVYMGDISQRLAAIDEKTGGISSVVNADGKLIAGQDTEVENADGGNYLISSASVGELWTVTLLQPVKVATETIRGTVFITILLGTFVFLMLTVMIVFVYKKHGKPIIRAFEEKDFLIINQARQAQLGEMVGNIAHQLKQPLNGVNMALSNLQEDYCDQIQESDRQDFVEHIGRMKRRINGMAETVDDFMGFLRPQREQTDFYAKNEIINMVDLMKESINIDMIRVEIEGEDFLLSGHKNEFGQCVFNILDNAREAVKDKREKKIGIFLDIVEKASGKEGRIRITDNGGGVDERLMDRIFDLYFTTKETSEGNGIGLYMTKSIIERHFAGKIICHNKADGACFEIYIPLEEREDGRHGCS